MKFCSWNVNGIRARMKTGDFQAYFDAADADVICLQETKSTVEQACFAPEGYFAYWNPAERPGYSGTAAFSRAEPLSVSYGIGVADHDREGRVITLEFPEFFVVNVYTPNAQPELARLDYREVWEDAFRDYVCGLDASKPVLVCGDMNVAHNEIDLKNPNSNRNNAGFTDRERAKFGALLDAGFADTFRHFYPDLKGAYTWWSYFGGARGRNAGWRIDYWLISQRFLPSLKSAAIRAEILGSDHCPVEIEII
ncbi:MAG: exodeoxyribonuclease III [Oscillospiraceae bacterium]|nr:exodeoxyribonuclease III [Oscillospiraceae bacterium]